MGRKKKDTNHTKFKIEGFSRVALLENGEVIGDSGFVGPNQVTNEGFLNYLVKLLGAAAPYLATSR
jgi:hypothetical protein